MNPKKWDFIHKTYYTIETAVNETTPNVCPASEPEEGHSPQHAPGTWTDETWHQHSRNLCQIQRCSPCSPETKYLVSNLKLNSKQCYDEH